MSGRFSLDVGQPNADPPNTQRAATPACCHVGDGTVAAEPTVVSASAQATGVVPKVLVAAARSVHEDPDTSDKALLARTATIDIAVAADVVVMSGVGTN
jgi:hypothetical protein